MEILTEGIIYHPRFTASIKDAMIQAIENDEMEDGVIEPFTISNMNYFLSNSEKTDLWYYIDLYVKALIRTPSGEYVAPTNKNTLLTQISICDKQ